MDCGAKGGGGELAESCGRAFVHEEADLAQGYEKKSARD